MRQCVSIVRQSVSIVGRNVSIVGQSVSIVGQSVSIVGQSKSVLGHNVSIRGQCVSILGQNVSIVGQSVHRMVDCSCLGFLAGVTIEFRYADVVDERVRLAVVKGTHLDPAPVQWLHSACPFNSSVNMLSQSSAHRL